MNDRLNARQLLQIQASGALCFPVILIGHLVGAQMGLLEGLQLLMLGNLMAMVLALPLAACSAGRPVSTAGHAAAIFGKGGRLLFGTLMIIVMVGWFAIQADMMGATLAPLLERAHLPIPASLTSGLIALVTTLGLRGGAGALSRLSAVGAPMLLIGLIVIVAHQIGVPPDPVQPQAAGYSLALFTQVLGCSLASVVDTPSFVAPARSKSDAIVCTLLLYGIVVPAIQGVGLFLAAMHPSQSLVQALTPETSLAAMVGSALFLLLCGWTTNNANLFSAVASAQTLFSPSRLSPSESGSSGNLAKLLQNRPHLPVYLLGGVGAFLACFHPLQQLGPFLEIVSIGMSSMGALLLAQAVLPRLGRPLLPKVARLSWIVGSLVGLLGALGGPSATGVPALETFGVTLLLLSLASLFLKPVPFQEESEGITLRHCDEFYPNR